MKSLKYCHITHMLIFCSLTNVLLSYESALSVYYLECLKMK